MKVFFAFILFMCFQQNANAQNVELDASSWAKKLADPKDLKSEKYFSLDLILAHKDSITVFKFLDKLAKKSKGKNHYFLARYNTLKATNIRRFNPPKSNFSYNNNKDIKKEVSSVFDEALNQAYITDDDCVIALVSYIYGVAMNEFQEFGKSVMYLMNSLELYEKHNIKGSFPNYFILGQMLWEIREYDKSIKYEKSAVSLLKSGLNPNKLTEMFCYNTIGLAYHHLGQYDSAYYYYQKGFKLSSELEDKGQGKIWAGIISGNKAQIDYALKEYSKALPAFEMDYQNNKEYGYYGDAANSLQWAAKTNLALGNKEVALNQIRESFRLLKKWPTAHKYRQNAYQTASEIFQSLDNSDSSLYYTGKYNFLHDSLERNIYLSSLDISQLRLNNEKNRYNIQNLERSKNEQLNQRNYIIGGILLFAAFILLLINRQRLKLKFKSEQEYNEKLRIQDEMENARAQLKMFTQSTVEKTNLIEKLEMQVVDKMKTEQQKQLIEELSRQTILTEEDWLKFKVLFEKINPRFFEKLNSQVNNITQSEQRTAALTLFHLTNKQIAAVLGISPNSVIKSRQRLRQRLDFLTDQEAEEFIENL